MSKDIYSYHIFIMPFRWEGEEHAQVRMDDICKQLELRGCWEKIDYTQAAVSYINQDSRSLYAEKQYFHPYVQKAIYGGDENVVANYAFRIEQNDKLNYIIEKNDEVYKLLISSIRIKVYNTGVALVSIHCENHEYNDWKSIKAINDYGRRMALPFIPYDCTGSICADKIEIKSDNQADVDFSYDMKEIINSFNNDNRIPENRIGDYILQLLNFSLANDDREIRQFGEENIPADRKIIPICPILDDRMYVMCLANKNGQNIVRNKNSLYEFLFIDCEGSISCPNEEMRDSLLKEHTYERWIQQWTIYGTLYGMTAHSFVECSDFEPNINSFLTQYYQICCIVLAQRASLLNFKDEIMKLSFGVEERNKGIDTKHTKWLMSLQERYIAYQNQLDFFEISSQEQAIDIYEALRSANMIDKENEIFKNQLDNIYNAANVNLDYRLNVGGLAFAIAAIIIAFPSFLSDGSGIKINAINWYLTFGLPALIVVVFVIIKKAFGRKIKLNKR